MKINYVTVANENLASYRYRIQIPAKHLLDMGHEVVVGRVVEADVGLYGKHFDYSEYDCAKSGVHGKVVFDCIDDHFKGPHREYYAKMVEVADEVVCTTSFMWDVICEETGVSAHVIIDPYEFDEVSAHYGGTRNILWFGHQSNLPSLEKVLGHLDDYKLTTVSNATLAKKKINFVPWSPNAVRHELAVTDVVIIPSSTDRAKQVKGANRMVESIRRGRFVVANYTPAYDEFKKWMYIGDIQGGLEWVRKQSKGEIVKRITEAQAHVRKMFDPLKIAKKWESVLTSAVAVNS